MQLDKNDFIDLVNCPLTLEAYISKLQDKLIVSR